MYNLKTLLPAVTLSLLSSVSFAQELKKVSKKTDVCGASLKANYTVLKSSPEVKHGAYTSSIAWVSVKGQYDQGKKVGIWEYLSNGKVIQKFDVGTGKFLQDTISKIIDKITVLNEKGEAVSQADPKGIYLGADSRMACFISRCLRYPRTAMENNIQGKVRLSAILTKDGVLTDLKSVSTLGGGLEEEAVRVFQLLPQDWVPVTNDGNPVDAKIEFHCNFTLHNM